MRDDLPLRCADGLVHVAARTSPFLAERIRLEVAAGGSVGDLLAAMRLPRDVPARIFVTSRLVPDSDRERIFPAPGDVVTIRVIPQGGNKALGAILEFVVVAAAARPPSMWAVPAEYSPPPDSAPRQPRPAARSQGRRWGWSARSSRAH